jgi:signal transduction histidine kinase
MYGRIALAAIVGFVAIGLATEPPGRATLAVTGAILALAAGIPLFLLRPRFPLGFAATAGAGIVLVANGDSGSLSWFGICVIGGWCALGAGTHVGVAYWVASVVLFGGEWIFAAHDPGWVAWTAGVSLTVLAALLIRHQITLVEQMRGLQADLAQRSRVEERSRIARELHDVIAHSLTVSLLHVSGARLAVEHDPEDAARALADAERLTRQSLADVRVTVGLLRTPDDEGIEPPVLGARELPRLVDELRAARADVSLVIDGELTGFPAPTDATVYRIVQESLTNAARHAPGSRVQVRVTAYADRIDLSVDSAGSPGSGSGIGLMSMKERAEAVGGTFHAGPGGEGWMVHASLPRVASADADVS